MTKSTKRLRRWLAMARETWPSMLAAGWLFGGYVPFDYVARMARRPPADRLPAEHPERLVPDLEMSEAERQLWADLERRK